MEIFKKAILIPPSSSSSSGDTSRYLEIFDDYIYSIISEYVPLNNLFSTSTAMKERRYSTMHWKLTYLTTMKYDSDLEFKELVDSKTNDPEKQIIRTLTLTVRSMIGKSFSAYGLLMYEENESKSYYLTKKDLSEIVQVSIVLIHYYDTYFISCIIEVALIHVSHYSHYLSSVMVVSLPKMFLEIPTTL